MRDSWIDAMKTVYLSFALVISLAGTERMVPAQSRDVVATSAPPLMTATRVEEPVSLDGRLDEAAWQQAEAVSAFTQFEPIEGAPATQRTDVRVIYDTDNLYVGAVLYDENPAEIEPALGRRDEYNRADWFLVSIDSYFDKRTAYTFGLNAAGVQFDAIQTSSRRSGGDGGGNAPPGMDPSWDAIWYARERLTPEGWVVEMRIPYSMLRFSDAASQTWGIHFTRRIPRLYPFIN